VSELTYTIQTALEQRDWDVAVEGVRNAVIGEVKRLAPSVEVRYTDYFNHSFAPDLVLEWPDEEDDGARPTRHVYLRFEVTHDAFVEDIKHLRDGAPLFLGLRPQDQEGPFQYRLEDADPAERCLVTLADALDEWTPDEPRATDQTLATSALVQGGKGLVDHGTAADVGVAMTEGLSALFSGTDAEKVERALDAVEHLLPRDFGERLERQFWFFWLGSGGRPSDFRRRNFGLGSFEDDELRNLLRYVLAAQPLGDADYWRQLGMHLSAHRLGELLEHAEPSPNLDALVRANLAGWTVKGAGARPHPTVPLVHDLTWKVDQSMLALDVGDLVIYFTDDRRHYNNWPDDGRRPAWRELRPKLADHNVAQVEVITPENEVVIRRRAGQTLRADSADLERFASGTSAHDALRAVAVVVPGTATEARVDFGRRVVDAGESNVPLRTLAMLATRYLSGISEERLHDVEQFLNEGMPEARTAADAVA